MRSSPEPTIFSLLSMGNYNRSRQFDPTLPRWSPDPEIAWHPDRNSMHSPSSNTQATLRTSRSDYSLKRQLVVEKL